MLPVMEEEKSEILQALDELEGIGFTCRFMPRGGQLICIETGKAHDPSSLQVVALLRYEGAKDLSDQMVIYAITDGGSTRGVLIDSYGAYADADLGECIVKLGRTISKTYPERPLKDEVDVR